MLCGQTFHRLQGAYQPVLRNAPIPSRRQAFAEADLGLPCSYQGVLKTLPYNNGCFNAWFLGKKMEVFGLCRVCFSQFRGFQVLVFVFISWVTSNYFQIQISGTKYMTYKLVCVFWKWTDILFSLQGYFQLKANPGAWTLRLRKGRSEDIYRIYRWDRTRYALVSFLGKLLNHTGTITCESNSSLAHVQWIGWQIGFCTVHKACEMKEIHSFIKPSLCLRMYWNMSMFLTTLSQLKPVLQCSALIVCRKTCRRCKELISTL